MPTSRFSALTDEKPGKNRFSSDSAAPMSNGKKNRFSVVDSAPTEDNSSTFLDTALQAGGAVLDVISRPNYAVAGAAEELLSPQGGGLGAVLPRIGSELASGIGDVHGQKRGLGEVMERGGVGTGPKLSDAIPWLEDSWFNPSARGFTGLVGDIFLDPTTYLTFGASAGVKAGGKALTKEGVELLGKEVTQAAGSAAVRKATVAAVRAAEAAPKAFEETAKPLVRTTIIREMKEPGTASHAMLTKLAREQAERNVLAAAQSNPGLLAKSAVRFMGHEIPGSPALWAAKSGVSEAVASALSKTAAGSAALEATGKLKEGMSSLVNLVSPGWNVRGFEGAHALKTDTASKVAAQLGRWNTMVGEAAKKWEFNPAQLRRIAEAVDEGTISALQTPAMREAAEFIKKKGDEILAVDLPVFPSLKPVANYLAHFYTNDPDEIAKVANRFGEVFGKQGDLGRHLEERAFPTLREAERWSTAQNALDPSVPILKPLWDPWEALRRRGANSIKARNWRDYEAEMLARFGPDSVRFSPDDAFDLGMRGARAITSQEQQEIQGILALKSSDKQKLARIGQLSKLGKTAYFEERLALAASPQEAVSIMGKYQHEAAHFPAKRNWLGAQAAPDGSPWTTISLKGIGEATLPKTVADEVTAMDRRLLDFRTPEGKGVKQWLKTWDWINNTFKLGVTIFPAFHVRNYYNNVMQSFAEMGAAIFNPETRRDALRLVANKTPDVLVKNKLGEQMSLGQIRKVLEDRGVIQPGHSWLHYVTETTGAPINESKVRKAVEKVQGKVGGAIENEGRAAHALALWKRGMPMDQVVESVNKTLVNYQDLTEAERVFFRRVFPFWTWNSRNVAFQADALLHRPGLTAAQIKPFRGRESENQQMTSWEAGAMKIRLDGDGKTVRMITGVDLPIRNLDMFWRGSLGKTALGAIGMLSPAIKGPGEYAFGKSAFTGRDFGRTESGTAGRMIEHLPRSVQGWMGYKKEVDAAGRPKYTFDGYRFYLVAQSWAASRLISTSDRQFKQMAQDPNAAGALLDVLTGLRAKELNLTEEQAKLLQERQRQLEQAKIRAGEMKEFRRAYTPKAGQ